ncbi:hypothetical protein E2C01_096938 [Portunus trituberculatus]|uniref:Uncharacterized protein n=1 Tax=Portunus trituberculatus TaxID=210409 RepID=A0A5B7JWY4_PORTR|nr:hypothetical protein [Portunus trituberculatus]
MEIAAERRKSMMRGCGKEAQTLTNDGERDQLLSSNLRIK